MTPAWSRRVHGLAALAAGLMLLSGCDGNETASAGAGQSEGTGPAGEWTLVRLSWDGEVIDWPPGLVTLTLGESGGEGLAGCNQYRFQATISGSSMSVAGRVATTKRLCRAPGVMEGEARYVSMLESATVIERSEERLRLSGVAGTLEYVPNR